MHIKDNTINNYIKNNSYNFFVFENYWCKTLDDNIAYDELPNDFFMEKNSSGEWDRTKCIYDTKKNNLLCIHNPLCDLINFNRNNLFLLHFSNWSNPGRFMNSDNKIIYTLKKKHK